MRKKGDEMPRVKVWANRKDLKAIVFGGPGTYAMVARDDLAEPGDVALILDVPPEALAEEMPPLVSSLTRLLETNFRGVNTSNAHPSYWLQKAKTVLGVLADGMAERADFLDGKPSRLIEVDIYERDALYGAAKWIRATVESLEE